MIPFFHKFIPLSLVFVALYTLLSMAGHFFALPGQAAWVWPAAGVGFAAVLLLGPRGLLVPILGMLFSVLLMGEDVLRNFPLYFLPPAAEAYLGWLLLHWTSKKRVPLLRSREVILFLAAALLGSLAGAGLGVGLSFGGVGGLSGGIPWFFGDLAGILVIAPLLLMVFGLPLRRWAREVKRGFFPIFLSMGTLLTLGYVFESFGRILPFSWEFLTLTVIFASVWILRLPGLVLADFFLYLGTITHFAVGGQDHFGDPHFSLPQLQAFVVLAAGMGLVLNGFLQEQDGMRRRAEISERRLRRTLRQLQKELDREVGLLQERMNLKADLRQSKRREELGKRAGAVIHDYSNMMAALIGHVEQAKRFVGRGENPDQAFEVLTKGLFQAEILGRRILSDSDEEGIQVERISVEEIAREIFQLWKVLLPPGVGADLKIEPDLPTIQGDPVWLRQAILNLLRNAKEAVGARGRVELQVFQREGSLEPGDGCWQFGSSSSHVCVLVKDDGVGMPEEVRNKVLEPFFSTKGEGHGFGLSSVIQGIEHLEGGIRIESSSGEGTGVTLFLPISEEAQLIPAPPSSRRREEKFRKKHRILVIEDDPFIAEIFQRVIEEAGGEVFLAMDWAEGESILRAKDNQISLVLLDWSLPDVLGPEALEILSKNYSSLPLLVTSGFRERELLSYFQEVSRGPGRAIQFLGKPFRTQQLLSLLLDLLEGEDSPGEGAAGGEAPPEGPRQKDLRKEGRLKEDV